MRFFPRPHPLLFLCLLAELSFGGGDLLSTQARSFHTGDIAPTSAYRPESHVLVDLDNDGRPECVCAHQGNFTAGARISVQKNLGDGSFDTPQSYPAGGETMDVVAGDFNADGWNDVAFARSSNSFNGQSVIVMLNDGTGALLPYVSYPCGRGPTALVAFDADGDGSLDLVTTNSYWGEYDVTVLLNDGQAQFALRTDFPLGVSSNPWRLAFGDLDGDGDMDIATTFRDGSPAVVVLHNDGSGQFSNPLVLASPAGYIVAVPGLAIADVDLDLDQDIVFATSGGSLGGGYALFRNSGLGAFAAPENVGSQLPSGAASRLTVADVTLDGWPDVLGVGYSDKYGFSLVPGDGNGGFTAGKTLRAGEMSRAISTADLDGDGDLDVVITNHASINVTVHKNVSGSFQLPPVVATGFQSNRSTVGDLDNDGDLDVVCADTQIYRLINDGNGVLSAIAGGTSAGGIYQSPELARIDADVYPDLVAIRGQLQWLRNAGDGSFLPATTITVGSGLKQLKTVDIDGDGLIDIVLTAQAGFGQPNLYALRNLGGGTFAAPVPSTNTSVTSSAQLECADFNGDGRADVITAQGSALGLWLGDGSGAFTLNAQLSLGSLGGASYLASGDLDGDGDIDVVAASISGPSGPSITVLRNNGAGLFGAPTTYISLFSLQFSGCTGVTLLDCDHDGDLDIAAGSYGGNSVALFENRGDATFLPEARYGVNGAVTGIAAADLDGDGSDDVIANLSTEPPIGGGLSVLFGRPYIEPFTLYCTGKLNSLGCTPQISAIGAASATLSSGFDVLCTSTRNNKVGLLLNGISGRHNISFLGGILCVKSPRRTLGVFSGGTPAPVNDCSGVYSIDMNAFSRGLLGGTPLPELSQVGTLVNLQWWARDPGFPAPQGVALSNGLEYVVGL
jgi:hypothetical protein